MKGRKIPSLPWNESILLLKKNTHFLWEQHRLNTHLRPHLFTLFSSIYGYVSKKAHESAAPRSGCGNATDFRPFRWLQEKCHVLMKVTSPRLPCAGFKRCCKKKKGKLIGWPGPAWTEPVMQEQSIYMQRASHGHKECVHRMPRPWHMQAFFCSHDGNGLSSPCRWVELL